MPVSILGRFLVSERRNMRMPEKLEASVRSGVSSRPILNEIPIEEDAGPLLVTNASGQFVPTVRSKTRGVARYAFSEIPVEEESQLIAELYMTLLEASLAKRWRNRCNSVAEAVDRLRESTLEPTYLIVPEEALPEICGPDYDPAMVDHLMMTQGFVSVVDEIRILPANLPSNGALVTTAPALVGLYTRVGDYLGVMLQRVDRTVMVVGDGVA